MPHHVLAAHHGGGRVKSQISVARHHRWVPTIDEDVGVWELLGVPEDMVFEAAGFTSGMPAD